jgi:hypothetical protein
MFWLTFRYLRHALATLTTIVLVVLPPSGQGV